MGMGQGRCSLWFFLESGRDIIIIHVWYKMVVDMKIDFVQHDIPSIGMGLHLRWYGRLMGMVHRSVVGGFVINKNIVVLIFPEDGVRLAVRLVA